MQKIDSGRVVLEITRISGETGFRLPPDFTMIAKTLLNLDQVVHTLDPDFRSERFDSPERDRDHAQRMMQEPLARKPLQHAA